MRMKLVSAAIVVAIAALGSRARADGDRYEDQRAGHESAQSPAFVADVRMATLVRSNSDYFRHADNFGFPVPTSALGVSLNVGAELLPRLSLVGTASYFGQGATREGYAKLMVTSESLLIGGRYAFLRFDTAPVLAQLEVTVAGGRYWLKETFTDPLLSSQTYTANGSSLGFALGLDASIHVGPFRTVVGYAYHYAPATIGNRIGGTTEAGGHEISFGFGVRL